MFNIEVTISRTPSVLFKWIKSMNESSGKFSNLMDDHDKILEVKALCVLLCLETISVDEFLAWVVNLDIFGFGDLPPFFARWDPPSTRPSIVVQEMQKLRNDPNWLERYF
jgi:hypothetical protein